MSDSVLTVRAEVGSAAGDENPANGCPAHQARLASAEIDLVLQLKKALLSRSVHIVRDGRAAQRDRFAQHRLDGGAQPLQFFGGQVASLATRTNAGAKQTFIRINVAHTME